MMLETLGQCRASIDGDEGILALMCCEEFKGRIIAALDKYFPKESDSPAREALDYGGLNVAGDPLTNRVILCANTVSKNEGEPVEELLALNGIFAEIVARIVGVRIPRIGF